MFKTPMPKVSEIKHDWYLIDAEGATLGRLSTQIATLLQGKHKADFTPHLDMADNIVIINAAKIRVTGNKLDDKKYYRHSGYPGGIKEASLAQKLTKDPVEVIELAVKRMLPQNKLKAVRMKHLKVFATAEHTHTAQNPAKLEIK